MPKIYDDLRNTIVSEAKQLIVTKGYKKLNMREVASLSGVAVGTIYNYFPTKDALISELMYEYWREFIGSIQRVQESEADIFEKFRNIYGLLESSIDMFKDNWIRAEGVQKAMTQEHYQQKQGIMDLFISIIEAEIHKNSPQSHGAMEERELAGFIVHNFMMVAQSQEVRYETLETILKRYFL